MKGRVSELGTERWSQNGYHYTKTPQGWQLTHRILAEKQLGRPLKENERIRFKDANRSNLDPRNILVYEAREQTKARRRAILEARIADLTDKLEELENEE